MARRIHAGRYAQAVFEIALETKELDRWQSDLRNMVSVVGDTEFMAWLESPKVHFEDKAKLLSERLKEVNPLALNLVLLLVTKGRLSMLGEIADEYQRRLNSYRGIEPAEVITAIPLDDEDKHKLAEHLGALVGKKVVLKSEVDPALVGGFVARVGSKLLDGSTRNKLMTLKKELAGAGR
ncbi:MAG: ATP synthase F1 subunit delta [Dehalococcoidales bacterium]